MNNPQEKPSALSDSDLEGVVGGAATGAPAVGGVSSANIQGMDIETALMMVQAQRTTLLDAALKSQIQEVQNRNDTVTHLNEAMSSANHILATFGADAKPEAVFGANLTHEKRDELLASFTKEFGEAGVNLTEVLKDGQLTKAEIDGLITNTNGMIDAASNSQQMDMLRLQSMSNKRNEAFDVMTNFVKKMQDSRSSIIGNMR